MTTTHKFPLQVSTVTFVGGPVVGRPAEGWTRATASTFCRDYFEASGAVGGCSGIPGVHVNLAQAYCTDDVLVSGLLLEFFL